ncbi:Putative cytochrome b5-like heme/steroid binding domain, cytochrome b5, heme-binding protein [Septoria linicola]|uniref:Cytochrome b5-like heme/steroid binding domain, cytochrome b5, heme-binding protein n=1 Tax=Septoria linicola TaxID=215465 RepID=A0A9Q9EFV3_9PEZI|nr:putative cytochrome b5-like heme/steroid binding domain, cytochrome b5, heme-binding protein [Septoria linicola]USW47643.1 Putative cytochrome b5-like heme/steroid binding domain, cytochrome b5, heme-binding protein [Septoria linicola]
MGLLSTTIIVLVVAFLAHQYPLMLKSLLPAWLGPAESPKGSQTATGNHKDEEEDIEGDVTPKAKPQTGGVEVPTFELNQEDCSLNDKEDILSVPSFPAANSAQRASTMPPPSLPKQSMNHGAALMPPPLRPVPPHKSSPAASLRLPSTGPLPNRGPPAGSQQRVSSSLSPSSNVKPTSNSRNKVLLKPGHSPMDWAALTKKGNISGVSTFQRVTPSQLKSMTGRKGKPAWSSWQGKVYNITPYLPFHPGGEAELMKAAGRDGTKLFMEVHPWVNWENMLGTCLVGILVPENYGQGAESSLEDMD